jgi:hypothetical protein
MTTEELAGLVAEPEDLDAIAEDELERIFGVACTRPGKLVGVAGLMELSLTLQPGDTFAAIPVGVVNPVPAVRIGALGGAASLTVLGSPLDMARLGEALITAAGQE